MLYRLFLLLIFFIQVSVQTGTKCNQIIHNDAIFQLGRLSDRDDYFYVTEDHDKLYYKICQYSEHKCSEDDDTGSYGIVYENHSGKCLKLTGDQKYTGYQFSLIEPDNPNRGLILKFQGGDRQRKIKHIIECKKDQQEEYIIKKVRFHHQRLEYIIHATSPYGCPTARLSSITDYFQHHGTLKFFLQTIFGFAWCFYGRRLFELSMCIIGFLIAFLFIMLYIEEFLLDSGSNPFLIWVLVMMSIIGGVIAGYFSMKVPRVGMTFTGIWIGITITLIFQNAVLMQFGIKEDQMPFFFSMVLISNVLALLAWIYFQQFVIFFTALVGSYFLLKPIGYTLGNFPDGIRITQILFYKSVLDTSTTFKLWVIVISCQAALGMIYQWDQKQKGKDKINLVDLIPDIPEIMQKFSMIQLPQEERETKYVELINMSNQDNDFMHIGIRSDEDNQNLSKNLSLDGTQKNLQQKNDISQSDENPFDQSIQVKKLQYDSGKGSDEIDVTVEKGNKTIQRKWMEDDPSQKEFQLSQQLSNKKRNEIKLENHTEEVINISDFADMQDQSMNASANLVKQQSQGPQKCKIFNNQNEKVGVSNIQKQTNLSYSSEVEDELDLKLKQFQLQNRDKSQTKETPKVFKNIGDL